MVVTSSKTLRPLGNPAASMPINPRLLGLCRVGGMAMFSRSMSAWTVPLPVTFWKPGTMPAGIPVSRIASRSARGLPEALSAARLGKTPGYRTGRSWDSSGAETSPANCLSLTGAWELKKSFFEMGTRTSLNRGLPRRETWTKGPLLTMVPSSSNIRERWRLAVA